MQRCLSEECRNGDGMWSYIGFISYLLMLIPVSPSPSLYFASSSFFKYSSSIVLFSFTCSYSTYFHLLHLLLSLLLCLPSSSTTPFLSSSCSFPFSFVIFSSLFWIYIFPHISLHMLLLLFYLFSFPPMSSSFLLLSLNVLLPLRYTGQHNYGIRACKGYRYIIPSDPTVYRSIEA